MRSVGVDEQKKTKRVPETSFFTCPSGSTQELIPTPGCLLCSQIRCYSTREREKEASKVRQCEGKEERERWVRKRIDCSLPPFLRPFTFRSNNAEGDAPVKVPVPQLRQRPNHGQLLRPTRVRGVERWRGRAEADVHIVEVEVIVSVSDGEAVRERRLLVCVVVGRLHVCRRRLMAG